MQPKNNTPTLNAQPGRKLNESNLLLGLSIIGLIISLLPITLISPLLAISILVFDVLFLVLAIVSLIRSRASSQDGRGKYITAIVLSTIAAIALSLQFIIFPLIDSTLKNAACSLQTVVDPAECGADYRLQSGQEFKQN